MSREYVNNAELVNTCFNNNQTITSVDCSNLPWQNNSMYNAFNYCNNLQTVTNINQNVTNMMYTFQDCSSLANAPVIPNSVTNMRGTFYDCRGLVNAPVIPNSVTSMIQTFYGCTNLVNAPIIPNSVTSMSSTFILCSLVNAPVIPNSVTDMSFIFASCQQLVNTPAIPNSVINMAYAFMDCSNLTGNINIQSNQVSDASLCFYDTTLTKNVYIPFKYENGVNTITYNSFIAAGYSTTTRVDGVLLKDINAPVRKYVETTGYNFTNINDAVTLDKYIGTTTTVVMPTLQEE